ncbi:helix-turn-helix DNA binding domain protein [Rhodobacter phage RcDurkin]|nr:helix-turn-helix DNA binding domain protein [Rhodobacter phage RcDurkin]QXN72546.1 helix-turn-helix DNA binding domain protein [Rhodobacter phage RcTiptonus]UUV43821.1 helix-turn-helix DNA binding domain protein [Rhodobacter phage RcKickapoo]UUV44447.1 helix-turn-helix DNA binding domain protein [Rhodobacter phage RcMenchie]
MKLKKLKIKSKPAVKQPVVQSIAKPKRGAAILAASKSIPSELMTVTTHGPGAIKATLRAVLITKLADHLGFTYQAFWRWMTNGQLPQTIFFDGGSPSKERGVFALQEAEAIAAGLAAHFAVYDYLRKDHYATIAKIADAVDAARKEIKSQTQGVEHGDHQKARGREGHGKQVVRPRPGKRR